MSETVTIDRASVDKLVSRPRSRKPAAVSASTLAQHLDCSRAYIAKLATEGVLHRAGGSGFDLMRRVWPTYGSCGASGGNRHAVRRTLIFSGRSLN